MIKKITILCLSVLLIFSLCASAEEPTQQNNDITQQIPQRPNGENRMPPEGFTERGDMRTPPEGFTEGDMHTPPEVFPQEQTPENPNQENPNGNRQWNFPQDGNMRGNFPGFDRNMQPQEIEETPKTLKDILKEYFTPILSVILLALAFPFVIFYKRKTY